MKLNASGESNIIRKYSRVDTLQTTSDEHVMGVGRGVCQSSVCSDFKSTLMRAGPFALYAPIRAYPRVSARTRPCAIRESVVLELVESNDDVHTIRTDARIRA